MKPLLLVDGIMPVGVTLVERSSCGVDYSYTTDAITPKAINDWASAHGSVRNGAIEMGYRIPVVEMYKDGVLIVRLRSV